MKPRWAGYYDNLSTYATGDVVIRSGFVHMARSFILGQSPTPRVWDVCGDWITLGKQENCKIDHYYHPEGIQVPLPSGKMSEMTYVCSDCWKNSNFAAAFMADEHAYVIQELPG